MTGAREASPRGKCRFCCRTYALTLAGRLRVHVIKGTGLMCDGSGQLPA